MRSDIFPLGVNHQSSNNNVKRFIHVCSLDTALQVGEFIICEVPEVTAAPSKLIGRIACIEHTMNDIPTNEVTEDFLECLLCTTLCLIEVWKVPNITSFGYVRLTGIEQYNLQNMIELDKSREGFWATADNITNIAFVFSYENNLRTLHYPSLNGVHNFYYNRYYENASRVYTDYDEFIPFLDHNFLLQNIYINDASERSVRN